MSAAGAAPSAILSLEEVMELLLLSSPLTPVSINLGNDLQLTISPDTSTQNLGIEPADLNVEITLSSATSAYNLVVRTTSRVLQRALSTFPETILSFLRRLTSYVAPAPWLTSSVAPHISGSGSNPSRKRQKLIDASSPASDWVKELTAEERDAILIKAYEKNRVVRDEVDAAFYQRRAYVNNIPITALSQDLYNFFVTFGEIADIKIVSRSSSVAPSAPLTSPAVTNAMTSSVVPRMSGSGSNPSRKRQNLKRQKLTDASLVALARMKELTAEERDAILIKAYEKNRVVRDEVHAAFYQRRVHVHNIPVHNISFAALSQYLYNFFVPFGEIVKIEILYQWRLEKAIIVGYVVFGKPEFAEKAVNFGSEIKWPEPDFLLPDIEWHVGSVDCSLCSEAFL